jgi:hypothetical protein
VTKFENNRHRRRQFKLRRDALSRFARTIWELASPSVACPLREQKSAGAGIGPIDLPVLQNTGNFKVSPYVGLSSLTSARGQSRKLTSIDE